MQDVIDRAWDVDKFGDIVLQHPESRMSREMPHVGSRTCDQVVDRENLPAVLEEAIAQVGSQKSGTSRDYRAQWNVLPWLPSCVRWPFFMVKYSLT
jgi:hypothetical protein